MKCNHDCFNCPYETCVEDDLTAEEIAMSEWLDNIAEKENEVDSSAVIRTGKRGRPRKVNPKYKSKEYAQRQLEKAKEYYYKHKEERIAYQKAYYAERMKNPANRKRHNDKSKEYYRNLSEKERTDYIAKRKAYNTEYKRRIRERQAAVR